MSSINEMSLDEMTKEMRDGWAVEYSAEILRGSGYDMPYSQAVEFIKKSRGDDYDFRFIVLRRVHQILSRAIEGHKPRRVELDDLDALLERHERRSGILMQICMIADFGNPRA
jgi:hypothetical protein